MLNYFLEWLVANKSVVCNEWGSMAAGPFSHPMRHLVSLMSSVTSWFKGFYERYEDAQIETGTPFMCYKDSANSTSG